MRVEMRGGVPALVSVSFESEDDGHKWLEQLRKEGFVVEQIGGSPTGDFQVF